MSNANSLLRAELDRFGDQHRLTAREHDVMFLLATGCSTVPVIAERLGLSQNTIHNHFKNIFRRTRTNSKAGLLSLLINEALGRLSSLQPFVQRPRILLIEPDDAERLRAIETLEARGVDTVWELRGDAVIERLRERRIDAVVMDGEVALAGEPNPLRRIVEHFGRHPIVVITNASAGGQGTAEHDQLISQGARAVLPKPLDVDRVLFALLENHVGTPYERSRLVRVETDLPVRIDSGTQGAIGNLAFGGAFVALRDEDMDASTLPVGSRLRLAFDLDERERVDVEGEVRWRRESSRPASRAGVGVQFVNCDNGRRDAIEQFVRRRKLGTLHSARGTGPMGARV